MNGVWTELRYAYRSLRRTPLFTAVAIVSLTLAVGANTAVFTLLNALLWRDVAVRDPHTLVQLTTVDRNGDEAGISWPIFRELHQRDDLFAATLGWLTSGTVNVETSGGPMRGALAGVSGELYAELGAVAAAGRLLGEGDVDLARDTAAPVVVIGWNFWQRAFAGSPAAIGQEIRVEGVPLTIVGVAPRGFTGLSLVVEPEIIVPLTMVPRFIGSERSMREGASRWVRVTGRLRPGATLDGVRAQLTTMWPMLRESTMPSSLTSAQRAQYHDVRLLVTSGARGDAISLRSDFAPPLYVVLVVAGIVAVITALNLCGLAYARAGARANELRIRLALGASRLRLLRASAVEGAMVGAVAAVCSVLVAAFVSDAVGRLFLEEYIVPTKFDAAPDARVVAMAMLLGGAIGVLMAVVPAWTIGRDAGATLAVGSSRTVARSGRAGRVLLTLQVAASIVLLIGAALLVRSLYTIASTDDGLRSAGVWVGYPSPLPGRYQGVDAESYYQQTLARVEAIPGVEAAAFTLFKPVSGAPPMEPVARVGTAPDLGGDVRATEATVSPGFFEVLGISLLQGRRFAWSDTIRSRRVVIVSRSLAERLFGPGGGLGERVRFGITPDFQDLEIVGIVDDARVHDVRSPNLFTVYFAALQSANANYKALVFRGPGSSVPEAQQLIASTGIDTMSNVVSLDYIMGRTVLSERMMAMLSAYFGGLALILAAIGIHGQMAYLVSLQRREIGVRIAVGATARQIAGWIVGRAMSVGLAGTALGVALAVPAVGAMQKLLVATSPYDVVAFTAAPLLLLAAVVAACLAPAVRATRIDPMVELRKE